MALVARPNKWGTIKRERILVFGGPKVGKSDMVMRLAELYEQTNTPGQFYYIDTDGHLDSIEADGQYADLANIIPYEVYGWERLFDAGKEIESKAGEGDWIVLDMAHRAAEWVEEWYLKCKYGTDNLAAKYAELKWEGQESDGSVKESKGFGDNPLIGQRDYKPMNAAYNSFFNPLALESRAHIICLTEKAGVYKGPGADAEKIRTYDKIGGKPKGHNSIDYNLSTLMHIEKTNFGRYITTVGDRGGRQLIDQVEYKDLFSSYLLPIAHWTIS